MRMMSIVTAAVAMAMSASHAWSADAAMASPAWKGEAELGVVATRGNTRTQTISAKAGATNENDNWRHNVKVEALTTAARDAVTGADKTTAERYGLAGKSDYKFTERDYAFGIVSYESDRFTGFDYRMSETIGYGRRLIHSDELTLDAEVGPGARQSKPINGDVDNEMMVRLAGNLGWKLSKTATFTEELSSDIGADVTITKSVTALKAQVAGNLAMKASLTIKHASEVPVGVSKTDAETALTLVFAY